MRILHTSDWHLGKYINNISRLEEQEMFIDELSELADERKIDLIIVAGDIYDVVNPPAAAEQLFYKAMRRLSIGRPVFVIAGNHDNPGRLTAASPLATELGVIMLGTPKSVAAIGDYEGFSIIDSGEGYTELKIGNENVVILAMPYPGEKRLDEILGDISSESEFQQTYSQRIGEIFERLSCKYRNDTVNLAVGHFYITGGEVTNSERDIQLGGAYAVDVSALPRDAQYIAMGHLHRSQKVSSVEHAYYSGSPIAYSVNEGNTAKCVYVSDIHAGGEAQTEKVYLRNYKPFITIEAASASEAAEKMNAIDYDCWIIVKINAGRPLMTSEIKEIRSAKGDVLEILNDIEYNAEYEAIFEDSEISPAKQFLNFYTEKRGTEPTDEMIALFLELSNIDDPEEHNLSNDSENRASGGDL